MQQLLPTVTSALFRRLARLFLPPPSPFTDELTLGAGHPDAVLRSAKGIESIPGASGGSQVRPG